MLRFLDGSEKVLVGYEIELPLRYNLVFAKYSISTRRHPQNLPFEGPHQSATNTQSHVNRHDVLRNA